MSDLVRARLQLTVLKKNNAATEKRNRFFKEVIFIDENSLVFITLTKGLSEWFS